MYKGQHGVIDEMAKYVKRYLELITRIGTSGI